MRLRPPGHPSTDGRWQGEGWRGTGCQVPWLQELNGPIGNSPLPRLNYPGNTEEGVTRIAHQVQCRKVWHTGKQACPATPLSTTRGRRNIQIRTHFCCHFFMEKKSTRMYAYVYTVFTYITRLSHICICWLPRISVASTRHRLLCQ